MLFKEDFQLPEGWTARLNNRQIEFLIQKCKWRFYPQKVIDSPSELPIDFESTRKFD